MEDMKEVNTPKWLEKIQNNSWEPEIIISGFTVAFLFILPKYVYNFSAMLIQDFGTNNSITFFLYVFMIYIITSVKVLLIGHLILRGLWTGLVGLSYVFPNGIRREMLPKKMKDVPFEKPVELVINIEKICSLIFSFAFTVILILVISLSFYVIIIFINIFLQALNAESSVISLIEKIWIGFVFIGALLLLTVFKKSKLHEYTVKGLSSNLQYTFSTNLGKRKTTLLFLSFIILTFPLSYSNISKFKFDVRRSRKVRNSEFPIYDQEYYLDVRNNDLRVQRAVVNSFDIIKNHLNLYISSYKNDESLIRKIKEEFDLYDALIPNNDIIKLNQTSIYQFFIDDKQIFLNNWIIIKDNHNSQQFLMAEIPIKNLSSGIHNLSIKRIRWRSKKKEFKLTENWVNIPFKKVNEL